MDIPQLPIEIIELIIQKKNEIEAYELENHKNKFGFVVDNLLRLEYKYCDRYDFDIEDDTGIELEYRDEDTGERKIVTQYSISENVRDYPDVDTFYQYMLDKQHLKYRRNDYYYNVLNGGYELHRMCIYDNESWYNHETIFKYYYKFFFDDSFDEDKVEDITFDEYFTIHNCYQFNDEYEQFEDTNLKFHKFIYNNKCLPFYKNLF